MRAILLLPLVIAAAPPGGGDPALAPWFQSLQQPGTEISCCSIADCRPVKVRTVGADVEAFISRPSFGAGAPDAWVRVPTEVMIRGRENPLGEPVVCFYGGKVRCFIDGAGT